MKTIIKKSLLLGVVAFSMVSCKENSWNDTYLDGFVGGPDMSNVQTLAYTLTNDDYKNLADNSANKAKASEAGVSNELEAVGTLHYLNDAIAPADYIPNFLSDPDFQYFTLSEGSAINVTYKIAQDLPEEMVGMNAAAVYDVTTADYQESYGSDENYAESFSPAAPASGNIPRILKANFPSAQSGNYVVVNYNNSETSPVFGNVEEKEETIADAQEGKTMTLKGVVTAICNQGFILSDNTASILVYKGKNYDKAYVVGDYVEVSGEVGVFNNGLQFGESTTITKLGTEPVKYGTPKVYTGADMDAALNPGVDFLAVYCTLKATVSVSGTYYNFSVAGATAANGSFYQLTDAQKAMLEDGKEYEITGYFISVSKSNGVPKFFNVIPVEVKAAGAAVRSVKTRAVAQIASTATSALYLYDGSKWAAVSDVTVLQPADYLQMGVDGALTEDQAATMIPMFLAKTYPYAAEKTKKYVLYSFKNGEDVDQRSVEYTYDGEKWVDSISHEGVISETNQFVFKGGAWKMDPSIELTLPVGKNKPTSTWFYQAVVDWVKNNVADGADYVDSYGTAEYYSGCSSYQGNVNINMDYDAIKGNSHYAGMSPEEIEALMKKRFEEETGPGALSTLYPDMSPIGDLQPTVTITFTAWCTGKVNKVYTIVFKCVEKGKFEFVSCTWNSEAE